MPKGKLRAAERRRQRCRQQSSSSEEESEWEAISCGATIRLRKVKKLPSKQENDVPVESHAENVKKPPVPLEEGSRPESLDSDHRWSDYLYDVDDEDSLELDLNRDTLIIRLCNIINMSDAGQAPGFGRFVTQQVVLHAYRSQCLVCRNKIVHFRNLLRHLQQHACWMHHQFQPLVPCSTCGKTFGSAKGIVGRRSLHALPFYCAVCGKSFATDTRLRLHHRTHLQREYACGFADCGATLTSLRTLRNHLTRKHRGLPDPRFGCNICGDVFVEMDALEAHLNEAHRPRPASPSTPPTEAPPSSRKAGTALKSPSP